MAVLVEGFTVVVALDAVARHLPGGWPAFERLAQGAAPHADRRLGRAVFLSAAQARGFAATLALRAGDVPGGPGLDPVLVCQLRGPLSAREWLVFERPVGRCGERLATVRHRDDPDTGWSAPPGWRWSRSIARAFESAPLGSPASGLRLLGTEDGLDVYWDEVVGRQVFVARAGRR